MPVSARAALGGVNNGVQVTYGDGQILMTVVVGASHRIKVAITGVGNSCTAQVDYELQPSRTQFELRHTITNEPMFISDMVAEEVACWVSPFDEVGQPPAAAERP